MVVCLFFNGEKEHITKMSRIHTVDPQSIAMVCKPHGTPRPTRMSKTLLPIVLDTAMSPRPAKEKQPSGKNKG